MKSFSEACEQNKKPILSVIRDEFRNCQQILEIGSGTGQHAVYFSRHLKDSTWQTSDLQENHVSINAWISEAGLTNLLVPLPLDVELLPWRTGTYNGVFSANTTHIMSWQQVQKLFLGINDVLEAGGVFCLYGPFNYEGKYTSASNERFDSWLKQRDPKSGIRDFESLSEIALEFNWQLSSDHTMPANNRILVWKKPLTNNKTQDSEA